MSEHTPGPWFVHDFADPAVSSDPSPADVMVSCDHPATITVAFMGNALTATLEEARANARLIASAPDLAAENARLREAIQAAVAEAKDLSGRLHRSHAWNQSAVSSWLANHAGKLERATEDRT